MTIFIQIETDSPELYAKLIAHPDAKERSRVVMPFGTLHRVVFHAPESLQAALQGVCHACDDRGYEDHPGIGREICRECR